MAAHARLKNEFTEDEKCHNLMIWLIYVIVVLMSCLYRTFDAPETRNLVTLTPASFIARSAIVSSPLTDAWKTLGCLRRIAHRLFYATAKYI